jgi:hypothetical protein
LNRESERIPRRFCLTAALRGLRGMRAYLKMANFLTVEDSLQLAAGSSIVVVTVCDAYTLSEYAKDSVYENPHLKSNGRQCKPEQCQSLSSISALSSA